MKYKDELIRSMKWLGEKENTLFLGQATAFSGHSISGTLTEVPKNRLIELPVMEEVQMGMCAGLSLEGYVPISIYPRFNFMMLAINQLVNHIDKMKKMSKSLLVPKVIVRVAVGARKPLDGGEQHTQDHTQAFKNLLKRVHVVVLDEWHDVFPAFQHAYERQPISKYDSLVTLLIEWGAHYNAK